MALLPILQYPDRRLHKIAKPVEQVDDRIRELVRNMAETMYAAPGIGLAATQGDVHERVGVSDSYEEGNEMQAERESVGEGKRVERGEDVGGRRDIKKKK